MITIEERNRLTKRIFDSLIANPENGLGEVADCTDEAERIVTDVFGELSDEEPATFTFYMGSAKIETAYLNELRDYVEEIQSLKGELSSPISDFLFSVESTYQQFYELDENNWEIVHN
jgi:hypothetical protein